MHASKFLVVLAAAFSPAMGLALPQGCGQPASGSGVTAASIPAEPAPAEPAPEEPEPAPAKPAPEAPAGESVASSISGQIISGVISSIIGEAPGLIGGLLHGGDDSGSGSSGSDQQAALSSCIQNTQSCCDNVQGKSQDDSACGDATVKAAFATKNACAGQDDSALQKASDACKTALGM